VQNSAAEIQFEIANRKNGRATSNPTAEGVQSG
jgi:hypothetical protein